MDRGDWEGRLRTRKRKDGDDVAIQSGEQSKQPLVKVSDGNIHKLAFPISRRESEGAPLVRRSTRLRAQLDDKPLKKCNYHKPKPSKPSPLEEDASPSSISASDNSNYLESGQDEFSQDFDLEATAANGSAFPKRRQSERLKNRGATDYSGTGTTAVGVPDYNASFNESPHEPDDDELCCFTCQSGLAANLLLLCDGDGCDLAVHTFCLAPPMQDVPEGSWICPNCKENPSLTEDFKEQHGFAKKTVQSVVGRRWVCIEGDKNVMQEQCLVKWHSLSHYLDTWIPVEWLYQLDRVRFHNFRQMFPKDADTLATTDLRKPEWFKIDRVIACRKRSYSKEVCDIVNLCHWSQQDGQYEHLVKWKGLEA